MRRRAVVVAGLVALVIVAGGPARAYLKFGTAVDGRTVDLQWGALPVGYVLSNREVPGVSAAAFASTVDQAFQTWESLPTAAVSFRRSGMAGVDPEEEDGLTVLGFDDRPDLDRVLGATSYTIDTSTGQIVEADVFFNTTFAWSVASSGEPGRYDLASIAVHEIGHLLGLGHSALGETELRPSGGRRVVASGAVMFPVAMAPGNIDGRDLRPDDVAGVSDLYPDGSVSQQTGSISGRVRKGGRGVFGAHVVALNLRTGALVGNFTLNQSGEYVIAGLDPGPTVVRVEPLDDADLESFFEETTTVDIDFQVAFARRLVVVPAGGGVTRVDVDVKSK